MARARRLGPRGLELIKHYEGFRARVYKDAAGHPTIGYGHLLKPGENFRVITKEFGEQLLKDDVQHAERAVVELVVARLKQHEFDALVSFVFNLGQGAFRKSTLRKVVNKRQSAYVPRELSKWVHAGGQPLTGLARRRAAEAALYMGADTF